MRRRQRRGLKLWGQCSLIHKFSTAGLDTKDGNESANGRCDCQPQGSRELGWRGMVNESEPLINVVNEDKRKRLIETLAPKGKGSGISVPNSPIADGAPPAERRDLTHAGTCTERGKPVVLPLGKRTARDVDRAAGKGWRRKRRPSCNGADRATEEWRCPTQKGADFRRVWRHKKWDGHTETGVRRKGSGRVAAGASLRTVARRDGGAGLRRVL
jgi:hypothetical protein